MKGPGIKYIKTYFARRRCQMSESSIVDPTSRKLHPNELRTWKAHIIAVMAELAIISDFRLERQSWSTYRE